MDELVRPHPQPTVLERVAGWWSFIGSGRLISAAGSVLIVAAGCWWLLRAPAPPIEAGIPLASGVTAPGRETSATSSVAAPLVPPTGAQSAVTTTLPEPASSIVVQAAGAVAVPGVYSLPIGARVHQLIAAAGGVVEGADVDAVALASVMVDGQRIDVPLLSEGAPPMAAPVPTMPGGASGGVADGSAAEVAGPVDLNRATADELDTLPGVGPATAAAIVAWREANGPFASPDDLLEVRGIGPAKLDAIRAEVTT